MASSASLTRTASKSRAVKNHDLIAPRSTGRIDVQPVKGDFEAAIVKSSTRPGLEELPFIKPLTIQGIHATIFFQIS